MRAVTEIDRPELIWSEPAVTGIVRAGEQYTGTVTLRASDGRPLVGMILSEERRILLEKSELSGTTCEVVYGIDTVGLAPGAVIEGALVVLCDFTQARLPVRIEVEGALDGGAAQTPEQFAQLCREHPREAFRLFTDTHFPEMLTGAHAHLRALYRGLSHNPVTYEHMESFLVGAGLKKPLEFTVEEPSAQYFGVTQGTRGTFYIYKNTWGFARMDVSVEGDFIKVPHKQITTEEFVGRVFELDYLIDHARLGRGVRRGRIVLRGIAGTIVCEVVATRKKEDELFVAHTEAQRNVRLAKGYLSLRQKKTDFRTWSDRTEEILAQTEPGEETAEGILAAAWLACEKDDPKRALEILWPVKEGEVALETPHARAAYLSLARETGLLPEEQMEILPDLEKEARRAKADIDIAVLVEKERERIGQPDGAEERVRTRINLYEAGCNSPFLYQDLWEMLAKDASLLGRLSPLMMRVLMHAQRYGLMTEEVLARAAFLSHNLKRFSRPLYQLLARGYEKMPSDALLEAICRLILKGQPVRPSYARWYRLAIERDLRVTQIYEYYMESVEPDAGQAFPMPVLLYFAENDTLGADRRALLYASVIRHRDDDADTYQRYREKMRAFADESISQGRMNEDYATIYRNFFSRPHDPRGAGLLSGVLFAHRLDCTDPAAKQAIVTYESVAEEMAYPIRGGVAWIQYYGPSACIVLEDEQHRRYRADDRVTVRRLMEIPDGVTACLAMGIRHPGLLLAGCGENARRIHVDDKNLAACKLAADYDVLADDYRTALRQKILAYYLAHPDDFGRLEFTEQMDADRYAAADKAQTVTLLAAEGRHEEAFRLITERGFEGIPVGTLLQVASRMIETRESVYDEELLYLTAYVYQAGKYDDAMLCYLRDHFDGAMEALDALWEKLAGFSLDALPLSDKILRQAVFTQTWPAHEEEILDTFWRGQGNRATVAAFLGAAAISHLVEGKQLSETHITCMRELYESGNPISTGMKLCLLESCAQPMGTNERAAAADILAERLLAELLPRGIRLAFYANLSGRMLARYQLEDKQFIEAVFPPDAQVELIYRRAGETDWIAERMPDLYHGIRSREFLLLYGEEIEYYLRVTRGNETRDLPTRILRGKGAAYGSHTRLAMADEILRAEASGDKAAVRELLRRYKKADACVEQLFVPH